MDDRLRIALAHLQAGHWAPAEAALRALLAENPGDFNILHPLGVCLLQSRRLADAEAVLAQAVGIDASSAAAHFHRASALVALGQAEQGAASFLRACELDRHFVAAHLGGAMVLFQLQRPLEALGLLDACATPEQQAPAQLHCLRGYCLQQLGRNAQALEAYDSAIRADPGHLDAQFNRAMLLLHGDRNVEAIAAFQRVLDLQPLHAGALTGRARAWRRCANLTRAAEDFRRAAALDPNDAQLQSELGATLLDMGQAQEALVNLDRALALDPDSLQAQFSKGAALLRLGAARDALACLERFVRSSPDNAWAWNNIGLAHKALRQLPMALEAFDQAVRRDAAFDLAHANRANALYRLGRFPESRAASARALALHPANALTRWNHALCRLLLGEWPDAWSDFEARWARTDEPLFAARSFFHRPWWRGDVDPAGKRIFLHAEQGLGDTVQFCRYALELVQRGAHVILEVPATLKSLVQRSFGARVTVLSRGENIPEFDWHCPLLSLPFAFQTRTETIPAAVPYLTAAGARVAAWQSRLGPRSRPRLALVWSSGASDPQRDIPLSQWRVLDDGRWDIVGVQTQLQDADRAVLPCFSNLRWLGDAIEDFDDTAAILSQCDLVISVDTVVAHLAGAMARPVWIALPAAPDWRWQLGRSDSSWYPTARLFRQSRLEQWDDVVNAVVQALARDVTF